MNAKDIEHPQRRVVQYWYADGNFEFGMGGLCLLLAAYFWLQPRLEGLWIGKLSSLLIVLLAFAGGLLINRLVRLMKERITFPRSGYVNFQREHSLSRGVRILISMMIGIVIITSSILLTAYYPDVVNWAAAVSGFLLAILLSFLAWRTHLLRFYLLAGGSLILGMTTSLLSLEDWQSTTTFYAAMALTSLISGGITLAIYLRNNPKPVEPADGP